MPFKPKLFKIIISSHLDLLFYNVCKAVEIGFYGSFRFRINDYIYLLFIYALYLEIVTLI